MILKGCVCIMPLSLNAILLVSIMIIMSHKLKILISEIISYKRNRDA